MKLGGAKLVLVVDSIDMSTNVTLTPKQALSIRMSALLLNNNAPTSADQVVRKLFALQGQDFNAAKWSIAIRSGSSNLESASAEIERAFNEGLIVRSWPMRSTVHLVSAEDIGWIQNLTNPRTLKDWPKRRNFLEMADRDFDRMRAIAIEALQGGHRLNRKELVERWESEGIALKNGWSYHSVWALCQTGVTVFGPVGTNGELELVLADEWIKNPARFEEDAALAEIARRYFTGHGPATIQDMAWWTQLTIASIRKGISLLGSELVECDVDGKTMWVTQEQLDKDTQLGPLQVHRAFDEHLLGYKDRTLSLALPHSKKAMTINGIAQPTVVKDGRVVALWKVRDGEITPLDGERISKGDLKVATSQIQKARTFK